MAKGTPGSEAREYYDREPDYVHFPWAKRDWANGCARGTYVVFKTFFACFWFYFVPFSCLYLSFAIPFKFTDSEAAQHVVDPITI